MAAEVREAREALLVLLVAEVVGKVFVPTAPPWMEVAEAPAVILMPGLALLTSPTRVHKPAAAE